MRYILIFLTVVTGTVFLGIMRFANANTVCEEPVHIMISDSHLRLLHQIFNSGSSSRRLFTEVHYIVPGDPHLTVGMGHWTHSKLAKLFYRLKAKESNWQKMVTVWSNKMSNEQWHDFAQDTGEKNKDAEAISKGLTKLFCADNPSKECIKSSLDVWSDKVGSRFNSKEHWFHAGWRAVSILKPIAEQQVLYWAESVVSEGQRAAKERELITLIVLKAEIDGNIVGYCLGFVHPTFYANSDVAWLEEIYVNEELRRLGI